MGNVSQHGDHWNEALQRHMTKGSRESRAKSDDANLFHGIPLAKRIEQSTSFNNTTTAVIVVNVLLVALGTQLAASGKKAIEGLVHVEFTFAIFYTTELLLRLAAHGTQFFQEDVGWRIFDAFLVIVAVLEQFLRTLPAVSALRILRVLKVIKVLRVVRAMRAFEDLRIFLDSILASATTLFWSIIVMTFVIFIFAVFFMQGATESQEDWTEGVKARKPWHSLFAAMCALFEAATGGSDWNELADPLYDDGPHFYFAFLLYIGFFLFVLLNSLTGIFVERLVQMVANDQTVMMNERLCEKKHYASRVEDLFRSVDTDGLLELSLEQLSGHLTDKRMMAFATSLEIDEADLLVAFDIVTQNGTQNVDLDTFVTGCIKLRGSARSVDLVDVHLMQTRMSKSLCTFLEDHEGFRRHTVEQLRKLHDKIR